MTVPGVMVMEQQIGIDSSHVLHSLGHLSRGSCEPYKHVFLEMRFSTFCKRTSTRWSTGMILRSFRTTTVRLVAAFLDYPP